MNSMHRLAARSACALILGCASESIPGPPQGLPYSAAFRACGPADGPAVTIILGSGPIEPSNPSTPHVRITISQSLDQLPKHSWTVNNEAGAWYVSASNEFELAASGSVTVRAVGPDSSVLGSALLTFPTRGRISAGFTAQWIHAPVLCG